MTAVPAHYCTIPTAPASPAPRGSPPCPPGSPSPITTFRSCDRGKCLCERRRREEHEAMPDESPPASIDLDLVTKIVAAFVRRNQVAPDQLANVIAIVFQALGQLGKSLAELAGEPKPAVPVRRSVTKDHVICLTCGWRGVMLRRHLSTAHGLSLDQYRSRWKLPREHPMTAPGYSERRSTMAKQFRLGQFGRGARVAGKRLTSEDRTQGQPRSVRRGRPRSAPPT